MATEGLVLSDFLSTAGPYGNRVINFDKALEAVNLGRITPAEFEQVVYTATGQYVRPLYTGNNRPLAYEFSDTPTYTNTNPINSNASTTRRGTVRTPINTTVDATTRTVRAGKLLPPSGAPSTWSYVANSIASPIVAAGIGISLGRTIDSVLYNANPDFWDANGMSALNPETWDNLTTGIDYTDPVTGAAASLMNMIFGLNPETNEVTPYIDENAFAYMASWLYNAGAFSEGGNTGTSTDSLTLSKNILPVTFAYGSRGYVARSWSRYEYVAFVTSTSVYMCAGRSGNDYFSFLCSPQPFSYGVRTTTVSSSTYEPQASDYPTSTPSNAFSVTYNGLTVYVARIGMGSTYGFLRASFTVNGNAFTSATDEGKYAWLICHGSSTTRGIDGIGSQPDATQPTGLTGNPTTDLPILRQQYPDVFGAPIEQTTVNPDGTEETRRYVPFTLPIFGNNTDTQPTSGSQKQGEPSIDADTAPESLIDALTKILQQPREKPFDPDPTPPENPTDTGDGSTPLIVAPTGSASALWSVYHPTQSQIDQFGAWLWSNDFVDQLLKVFNNPMESIIGLHKIYATPIDAGQSTIAVGYLDSEVPSAYITQQYVSVDCGSVNLFEQFGNVFDYAPYTQVKLYLPFVGIVPLNVPEVMRSTISITYGIDVLTGACLAMVNVTRDGNDATLYQFAGNCAVQYPISSGSYMGIVSSILGVAGSVAATLATGGGVAPLAMGAAMSAFGAHTNVQNSGSFSGNAGAMGGKIPYLIISRPQSKIAASQDAFEGAPTNHTTTITECSGFIRCRDVHLTGCNATSEELDEIQQLLMSGIIV